MISNHYQNQPTFSGNLFKEGVRLPQKKFNEVAKLYAEKTKGMPDLILKGRLNNSDFDGQFYHSTHSMIKGNDFASIVTDSLKSMFKELSPTEIAEEFVNITKRFASQKQETNLLKEMESLEGKIQNIKTQLQHTSSPVMSERLQVIADRMQATLAKKEAEYSKMQLNKNEISTDWCI